MLSYVMWCPWKQAMSFPRKYDKQVNHGRYKNSKFFSLSRQEAYPYTSFTSEVGIDIEKREEE